MRTVELICSICGKKFKRAAKEQVRSQKLGRPAFCSRSCSGHHHLNNLGAHSGVGDTAYLKKYAGNRKDGFTGFRYYLRKAKARYPDSDVTLEDIKAQWELQDGCCSYTGIPLILKEKRKDEKDYQIASLDRIDSSKSYDKGNVQFVSFSINLMKGVMSDENTKELVALIKTTNSSEQNANHKQWNDQHPCTHRQHNDGCDSAPS